MRRLLLFLSMVFISLFLFSATVIIRSDGKDASDPGQWTWTGTELGDQSDATYATTNKGNRILRSSIANDPSYSGCTINNITVYVRAGQTTGNELLDYGLYNAGTDYYTGTPVTPPQNTFADYSNIWNTRPWDNQPWTPADIDNLVVAVIAQNNGKWDGEERVAEIWVVVDYTCAGTTTVGDGVNPGNTSLCPGDPATFLDSFTLQTDTGTDTITAVEVTFAAGTSAGIGLVEVTSDDGATVYGSIANPTDVQTISLSTSITATTTLTQYKIRITPKSHAAMPAPPGASYGVTGTVTALTSSYNKVYNDTASATITIDNLSPANPVWGTITPGNGQITLNWTNPGDGDFQEVVILRNTASITDAPQEGASYAPGNTIGTSTVVYVGTGTTYTDTGLTNGQSYYYKIFARDTCGNYSTGSETGPHVPGDPKVTPGSPSATVDSCSQITITAPYTDDVNGNSTTDVERQTNCTGTWQLVCGALSGSSPRTCVDSGLTGGTDYCYRITFNDPDGVNGTNPQTIGPYTTPPCSANDTTIVQNSVTIDSCKQLTATGSFTGDADGDGSLQVEYNTTNTWPGTVGCAILTGPSPRQCILGGLSPDTDYWVRFTYTDPDGVNGTNPEVLGPFHTPLCGADQDPPMVLILSPSRGAVIGGTERLKIQVYDEGGIASVEVSVDGGAYSSASLNANYNCGTNCGIYEYDVDTTVLTNDNHTLSIRATDPTSNTTIKSIGVVVNNAGGKPAGSGFLLRRTHGSRLCKDCHNLATHSSQWTGTKYGSWSVDCFQCHTPHKTTNIYLIRENLTTPNSGTKTVVFQQDDRTGDTNPQNSYLGAYDATGFPYDDGICEVCHTKTNHYRNDTSGGDHTHNQGTRCIKCHPHEKGFAPQGSCLDCHASRQGSIPRAQIVGGAAGSEGDDFIRPSRHVSNGTTTQIVTNFDCIVCHMEGDVSSTTGNIQTNPTYHGGDGGSTTVDLRNVDDATQVACAWPGKRLAGWTATTTDRDNMDSFCMNCHDSDTSSAIANRGGAWDIAVNATDSGLDTGGPVPRRFTPFNTQDNQLNANEVDTDIRNARQNMGVLDVRGQFNYQNLSGKQWASHHNLNQFTKRYTTRNTTYWPDAAWTTYTTKEGQNIQTAGETAGLHCSDCHLNEVNAHGSRNTFYMLSDMNGNDTAFQNPGEVTGTDICFKCHNRSVYGGGNSDTDNSRVQAHNQSGARCNNWWTSQAKGGASLGSTSQIAGKSGTTDLPYLTCHGGLNFGMIHGTNTTYNPGQSGTWTSKRYRFMGSGGSMRWYSPNSSTTGNDTSWEGTSQYGCYTIGAADTWGGCTQHTGFAKGNANRARPLEY